MEQQALPSALLPYVYTFLKRNGYKKTAKYFKKEAEPSALSDTSNAPGLLEFYGCYRQNALAEKKEEELKQSDIGRKRRKDEDQKESKSKKLKQHGPSSSESDSSASSGDEGDRKEGQKKVNRPQFVMAAKVAEPISKQPKVRSKISAKLTSQDSDESSDDDDIIAAYAKLPKHGKVAKLATKSPKVKESSSKVSTVLKVKPPSSDSDSDSGMEVKVKVEKMSPKHAAVPKLPAVKRKASSSSSSSSDEDATEIPVASLPKTKSKQKSSTPTPSKPVTVAAVTPKAKAVKQTKKKSSDSNSSSRDTDVSSLSKSAAKPSAKKTPTAPLKPAVIKKQSSSSESASDSDSSDEEPAKVSSKKPLQRLTSTPKPFSETKSPVVSSKAKAKKTSDSSSSSSYGSSSEEDDDGRPQSKKPGVKLSPVKAVPTPIAAQKQKPKPAAESSGSSESEESSSSSEEDVKPRLAKKSVIQPAVTTPKQPKSKGDKNECVTESGKKTKISNGSNKTVDTPTTAKCLNLPSSSSDSSDESDVDMDVSVGKTSASPFSKMTTPQQKTPLAVPKVSQKKSTPNTPFKRVNDDVVVEDRRLADNSFEAKRNSSGSWGERAHQVLKHTKGKSFRHEKTKKKRGSYKGGAIDFQVNSVKFGSD